MTATAPKLSSRAEKVTKTKMDTILITPALVKTWKKPSFQRPLNINAKVKALVEVLKINDGVIPGILTLGVVDDVIFKLDGQHRLEAFILTGLAEGYADIRYHYFDDEGEMGLEFFHLQEHLVVPRPDDKLRALEGSSEALQVIKKRCAVVGYDQIRRNAHKSSPIVSMSMLLRCWVGAAATTPTATSPSAVNIAQSMNVDESNMCADFVIIAEKAWGRDPEYQTLWKALNMTLCMWLYRNLVINQYSPRTPKVTKEQFKLCLQALSANAELVNWLRGRKLSEDHRSPTYKRIKDVFTARLRQEVGKQVFLPMPEWVSH